ncbi:MAG: glycosyltransferase family 9 protein, partial [Thermoplasmata archaeon]|nr:glycosyltransferase family 9 protein [Thermoplasmata archaeon]
MIKKLEKRGKVALARLIALFLRIDTIEPKDLERMRIGRLLVIRQHNQMGDMLLAVPAFRGLRSRFQDARISLVAAPINTDVMLNNPYLDEVFLYAKYSHRMRPDRLIQFIRTLRKRRFDTVIVLNSVSFSITSMLLALASGAAIRIGSTSRPFGHDLSARFYHLELPLPTDVELEDMHESEHNLYPLRALGIEETDLSSALVPFEWEERGSREFTAAAFGDGSYSVIHPGAGKVQNIWPPERFAEVSDALLERYGIRSVAVRGPVDDIYFARFLDACTSPPQVISCPTVGFLGALMRDAAVSVCNDTGVAHIAGAVGAGCAEIFGPTDPHRWKPV